MRVFSLLSNGMGGLDWSGLPLACDWLGIEDIDGLLYRLHTMKTHTPPAENTTKEA
jgi:hypothetical protein